MTAIGSGVGLVCRDINSGLGNQTREMARFIKPERILVVQSLEADSRQAHPEWFPDSPRTKMPIRPETYQKFAQGLHTILTCETFYYDDAPEFLRSIGVRSAVVANREFLHWHRDPGLPRPDVILMASDWAMEDVKGLRWSLLPPPVARDRLPFTLRTKATRFLHIAGWRARADRAGSHLVLTALPYIQEPVEITIFSQSDFPMSPGEQTVGKVKVTVVQTDVEDYRDLYRDQDVLLAPRRYGGLSLPLNEASSLGMPTIALDRHPENTILPYESLIPARHAGSFTTQGGLIEMFTADPVHLAAKIDELATKPHVVEFLSKRADQYAQSISWEALEPRYREILQR